MRTAIIITICAALAGPVIAQTITIETDPPGLDVYSAEGEFLGTAPVTLQNPPEENLTVIVKTRTRDFINVIETGDGQEDKTVVIAVPDKGKAFKPASFGLGILAGIGMSFITMLIIFVAAWGAY